MSYQTEYVKWLTAGQEGAPSQTELCVALQRLCTLHGAGANAAAAIITAWGSEMPGPVELAVVLDALRTVAGDDEGDYTIDWDSIDTAAQAGGFPGPVELGNLLVAIAASV